MSHRVKVKEPPRDGDPSQFQFHLKDGYELIGWTDSFEDAQDWLKGFGPTTTASVEDQRNWVFH